jgi:uncharacterized protein (DUF2461 family)
MEIFRISHLPIVNNQDFRADFVKLSEEDALKKTPKGFEKDNPASEFLKLKHFIAVKDLTDDQLIKPNFYKEVSKTFYTAIELNKFLRRAKEV